MAVLGAAAPMLLRLRNFFPLMLLFGLFFINPLLDQFRNYRGGPISLAISWDFVRKGHFDSFQNFMSVVYTENITYGRQLLGVLLFFVPRSIWPDKPIGSGAELAQEYGFVFSNISMNYFGDGYINFGYLGIVIFLIGFSIFCAKMDIAFWKNYYANSPYVNVSYLLLLGLIIFILRGDLLSSTAYTVGMLTAVWMVSKVAVKEHLIPTPPAWSHRA
jgi:hypothetical protein